MSDASWELQKALHTALEAGLSVPVYDAVPPSVNDDTWVTIGEATVTDDSDKTSDGQEHTVTVHAWDRSHQGQKVVKETLGAVYGVLHGRPLTVTGHTAWRVEFDFAETMRDPDGRTWHGLHRYRISTQSD